MNWTQNRKRKSLDKFIASKEWHEWFAWYPVKIELFEKVWWEKIERKRHCYTGGLFLGGCYWKYRKV